MNIKKPYRGKQLKLLALISNGFLLGMTVPVIALEFEYVCNFEPERSGFIPQRMSFTFDENFESVVVSDDIVRSVRKAPMKVLVTSLHGRKYQARWRLDLPVSINEHTSKRKWEAKYRATYDARIDLEALSAKMKVSLRSGQFRTQSSGVCHSKK